MGPQPRAALIAFVAACGPTGGGEGTHHDGGVATIDSDLDSGPDADPTTPDCTTLHLTIRDFSPTTHPDFEPPFDPDFGLPGIVQDTLGPDDKPVYAPPGPTEHTAGKAYFDQWYRDTPGINMHFEVTLPLSAMGAHGLVYDSMEFFPIDGKGYGDEGNPHNFHFTTEVHTTFDYNGGEDFTFIGDDDLWLFINKHLAIDLGGMHPPETGTVDLDARAAELGLTKGHRYAMDIFHAERHTDSSNFHIETTIHCFDVP